MTAIVSFFNRSGTKIAEVPASVDRTWVLNQYGQCEFVMDYGNDYCREDVVRFGNLVLITSEDERIPNWGGIIKTPRTWGADGLHIKCYSMEYMLNDRVGPKNKKYTGTCGSIVTNILNYANSKVDTRIWAGDIFMGGDTMEETLNYTPLYDDVNRVVTRKGYDWGVEPMLEPSKGLYFLLHLWMRRGQDLLYPELIEGYNIELADTPLTEDGPLHNDVFGYGDGATWDVKPSAEYEDPDSITKYGLLQAGKNFSGNVNVATVLKNTTEYVNTYRQPKEIFAVTVNDTPDAVYNDTFVNIKLGNTLPIKLSSYGFGKKNKFGIEGTIKVWGMGYNETDGKIVVVVNQDTSNTDQEV